MSIEIESTDVIRLIQQFLKEHNLPNALAALQDETSISLNTVESVESFVADVKKGNWDVVIRLVSQLKLPRKKLMDLYEQVVLELTEMRELGAARTLLRQTEPMQLLKEQYPERYMHLEHMLSRSYFDPKEAYPNGLSRDKRRQLLAQALSNEVCMVPPSRLLCLLGQAVKWQQQQGILPLGTEFDLFRGSAPITAAEEDAIPSKQYEIMKFPKKQHIESAVFSPNGVYFVTGSMDGLIEVWNYLTGKLRQDLSYQAEDKVMLMESAVLCLNFSRDSELIASGAQDGKIKVWRIETGQCFRKLGGAHTQGVTSVAFSRDGSQLLSSSFDHTIRLHGLKSGKVLREYRGHTSFVNNAIFSMDMSRIISASSDGTVRIWDTKNTDLLHTVVPQEARTGEMEINGISVNMVVQLPRNMDQFVVCNKSSIAYIMNVRGQVVKTFAAEQKQSNGEFIACALSPQGDLIYCVGEDMQLYCFRLESGKLEKHFKVAEADVIGISHHPMSNILAVYAEDGKVLLYKA